MQKKGLLRKVAGSAMLQSHATLFISTTVINALNFVYHLVMGRLLGPTEFGKFTALFSFFYLLYAFIVTIQSVVAQECARRAVRSENDSVEEYVAGAMRKILTYGSMAVALALISGPFVANLLNVSFIAYAIVALAVIPSLLMAAQRGRYQGEQKFSIFGRSLLVEGVVKLVVGVALVLLGLGASGALLGALVSVVAVVYSLDGLRLLKTKSASAGHLLRASLPFLVYSFFISATYSFDVLIAKIRFPEIVAGFYAALSLFGRIMFFATVSIPQVIFPQAVSQKAQGLSTRVLLQKTVLGMFFVVLSGAFFFWILGEVITTLLLGPSYQEIAPWIPLVAIAMGGVSMISLICMHDLAVGRMTTTWLLVAGVIAQMVLLVIVPPTLTLFITVLAVLYGGLAVVACTYALVKAD